jgi:Xaa-Pro aminopeptidase
MCTADDVGVPTAAEYRRVDSRLPVELVDATAAVNDAMTVNSRAEIERPRRANEICDVGIGAAVDSLAPGISAIELAGETERAQRRAGSEYSWSITRTEVGSGYNQARPDGFTPEPTEKRIQRGGLVTLDVHAVDDGYFGDLVAHAYVHHPGVGGMRLEMPALVSETGTERLSRVPLDLIRVPA